METREVIRNFYSGIARKDGTWADHLAAAVEFSDGSGRLAARGKDAFVEAFQSFLRAVESVEVKKLIVDGGDAAAVVGYDYVNPKGDRLHQDDAEVWRVEGGEVRSLTIYFDITEFSAFMRR